ncbi:Sec-independent protein translocase protein TatB [Devosia soli]|uniref:Sec-independent protein translocase protein TatB n=1 Tax=Devosia soli TaxID=361041 RepID=UPI00069C3A20|nr:Sec-independent protein translocase protein TatB [Devosia soli]
MLGLGWTEMLVIGVVALIVIGPKDLPVVMGRVGKFVGQIRRMGNEFQREINRTTGLDEVRNLRNSITSPLKKTAEEIRREFNTMTPTGPKPSGAIKPADPQSESVVDELRTAAGMPPRPKTNEELVAEYGFKPTELPPVTPAPVKAAQVTPPEPAAAAPTAPVTTADLPPVEVIKASKPVAKKPAVKRTVVKPDGEKVVEVDAKPVKKPRAPKATTTVSVEGAPAPAKKPRAPRKKPDEPAGTN